MRRDESRLYEGEIIKKQKKVCGGVHGIEIYLAGSPRCERPYGHRLRPGDNGATGTKSPEN